MSSTPPESQHATGSKLQQHKVYWQTHNIQGQKSLSGAGQGPDPGCPLEEKKSREGSYTRLAVLRTCDPDTVNMEPQQHWITLDAGFRESTSSTPQPGPQSDTAWPYFLWTPEPTVVSDNSSSLLVNHTSLLFPEWCRTMHTGAPTSSDFPPPALPPASGLWTTKDTAQAMNSLSRRWRGLSAIAIPFQQPCLLLCEATHKILELQ